MESFTDRYHRYVASFGPVTGLKTGSYHVAMINDWALAKQLFSKEEFSGRLCNFTTRWARSRASNEGSRRFNNLLVGRETFRPLSDQMDWSEAIRLRH